MAEDCLFCAIVAGRVPAKIVREDDDTVVFEDINPQAPLHVLVIPKKHIRDIAELSGDPETAVALLRSIRAVVEERGLSDFRTVFNTGAEAGQSVFHVHAHVLSGRPMGWPPG
ncbi:MAG: histidine triad family protein [Pseudonocardiales bacterium]|jgi:histidine triad (HIT) family protein|nr:histidine triad family protein [Pseudonocardiales bacterium]